MTKLIELKDKVFRFCAEYEMILHPVYKFVLAIILFTMIDNRLGYMESISKFWILLVLSLICAILPQNFTILAGAVLTILHLYTLSVEVALVAVILYLIVLLLYFRFAPKESSLFILTPVLHQWRMPFILPIGSGLLREVYSVAAVLCGTIMYYFLEGIRQNVSSLTAGMDTEDAATMKLTLAVNMLLSNKEMYLMLASILLASVVVYIVRKLSVEHAWKIAVLSGVLIQISVLVTGYLLLNIRGKTLMTIVGNVVALLLGFVMEFLFMDLDYERVERVQYEDDDYYYFVKAVPKKMVTSSEKVIKHFGNTAVLDKRVVTTKTTMVTESSKIDIAEELDIDRELLE